MIVSRPFGVNGGKIITKKGVDQMVFDVTVFTALGEFKITGWRYVESIGRMSPPAIPMGGVKFYHIVKLNKNQRSLILKLARRLLAHLRAEKPIEPIEKPALPEFEVIPPE